MCAEAVAARRADADPEGIITGLLVAIIILVMLVCIDFYVRSFSGFGGFNAKRSIFM